MGLFQELYSKFNLISYRKIDPDLEDELYIGLKNVSKQEIKSLDDGLHYIELLKKLREVLVSHDEHRGANFPNLLNSLLSVGEDGVYSDSLRFIFELIQNVDDCDYADEKDRMLDMRFDFHSDRIILTYNEIGFTPFNVFAITGIAEAAKNVSGQKNEIGEKGIGFKSVFGVANKVQIQSGWFSFELNKDNFTIPIPCYDKYQYTTGTVMTLFVPGKAKNIYYQIKNQYCKEDAIFKRNPLLFLNKLTYLKIYYDAFRSMEFRVSRSDINTENEYCVEQEVELSVDLNDHDSSKLDVASKKTVKCFRFTHNVVYSYEACKSRYGTDTKVGMHGGKKMNLQVVVPYPDDLHKVGNGTMYSFLPTRLGIRVPLVIHVPFKLDASREFVDPQNNNLWFQESCKYLSDLMSHTYMYLRKLVGNKIVYYIPHRNYSLFAENNGKEQCLSEQNIFKGRYFLQFPLFKTADGDFKKNGEIICFDNSENIQDQLKVHALLGLNYSLFILPNNVRMDIINGLGIEIKRGINKQLFEKSLSDKSKTSQILDYLESVGFIYDESLLNERSALSLAAAQIETIFKHEKLADQFRNMLSDSVKRNRTLSVSISDVTPEIINTYLYSSFDLSEVPKRVAEYLKNRRSLVVCLDIDGEQFMPCENVLVLSKNNPVVSFGEFCRKIDNRSTFAIRVRLNEISESLNNSVNDDSLDADSFLRDLQNIREIGKEALGPGYRSYIDLIQRAGTDKNRFIKELLQNADDCEFPDGEKPYFRLSLKDRVVRTEYNEVGFTRSNIRAITSIGESTKTRILADGTETTGEKGVGFKTIFTIASKVFIYSGDYHFSLSAEEPTIPKLVPVPDDKTSGTRMEIALKNGVDFPRYSDTDLIELCLCLRKLKSIEVGARAIEITDTGDHRKISVGNKEYLFRRFVHDFYVHDDAALTERENGIYSVSRNQSIVCYVPEKNSVLKNHWLYVGLPTTHKFNNTPMVIDAPFMLTTSREQIENDCKVWNNLVRREMYLAIFELMNSLKKEKRSDVFQYIHLIYRFQGNNRYGYVNDLTNNPYLNEYDVVSELNIRALLPTLNKDVFAVPKEHTAKIYPPFVVHLYKELLDQEPDNIKKQNIIDYNKEDENSSNVFKALCCVEASFSDVFTLIQRYAEEHIDDDEFRKGLYDYLSVEAENISDSYKEKLRDMRIIPVYGMSKSEIRYVSWQKDKIFVKEDLNVHDADYYILVRSILPKDKCEKIIGCNINEMNDNYERHLYYDKLIKSIDEYGKIDLFRIKLYNYLLNEFRNGNLKKYNAFDELVSRKELIPLKNQNGDLVSSDSVFVCTQPEGYFTIEMIKEVSVSSECQDLASNLRCKDLCNIHYEDLEYDEMLTEYDVEELGDDYFVNRDEILRRFFIDGLVTDEMLDKCGFGYLTISRTNEDDDDDDLEFPSLQAGDIEQLKRHIRKDLDNPLKVVSVTEEQKVLKWKDKYGKLYPIDYSDQREKTIIRYTPKYAPTKCFCQMCLRPKFYKYIEVNSIQKEPKYYYPQLSIALCLECSKNYVVLRGENDKVVNEFIRNIMSIRIGSEGKITIPIIKGYEITFTAKHLAEIQEIIRSTEYMTV